MSNDALIIGLSANLDPVRRRTGARDAGLLLLLGGGELAAFLAAGLMRPDMGRMIGSGYMAWKLGSLALLAAAGCVTAIRSLSPTVSPRRGLAITLVLAGAAIITGGLVSPGIAGEGSLIARLAPAHGAICALAIVVLSLPVMAMLAMLMRRGAPVHPEGSALASGLAAGSWGALIFALCCPSNDPLYIIVWYSIGCAAVTVIARWLLPKGFRL